MRCPTCSSSGMIENPELYVFWCISCDTMYELKEIQFTINKRVKERKQDGA